MITKTDLGEYNKKPVRFLHADLLAFNELVIKYANCPEGFSAKETINQYLDAFLIRTGE